MFTRQVAIIVHFFNIFSPNDAHQQAERLMRSSAVCDGYI